MSSSNNEAAFSSRYNRSLERSRARREEAGRTRRRRIRLRGGGLSAALVALALAVVGAGAAVGQQATGASSGLVAAGAQGSEVTAIQRALGIPASGAFDANTEAAVKQFQQRNGLAVDGIVGPQTGAALGLAPAPATSAPASTGSGTAASGGGGQYRGKYQFTRESWAAVGGTGDPAAAPEAEQDRRAAMLYAQSGASNWPACGR